MPSKRPTEIVVHIPACWEAWTIEEPRPGQVAFLAERFPVPIHDQLPTPPELLKIDRAVLQLKILGESVLEVLEELKPEFHLSYVKRKLLRASGTTICITGYGGNDVVFATWDYGEPVEVAYSRLKQMQRILRFFPPVARACLELKREPLPPPQVVLSNVINAGIAVPPMPLAGYNGGGSPIAIAVGTQLTTVTFDHRLYNPPQEACFTSALRRVLTRRLTS